MGLLDGLLLAAFCITQVCINIAMLWKLDQLQKNDNAILIALAFYKERQQEAEVKKCSSKKELSFM